MDVKGSNWDVHIEHWVDPSRYFFGFKIKGVKITFQLFLPQILLKILLECLLQYFYYLSKLIRELDIKNVLNVK